MSSTTAFEDFIARQSVYDRRRRVLHRVLRAIGFRLCRIEVSGLEYIPESGPTILMMNHISFIDPIVFTAVVPNRYVISMAKAEAYDQWIIRAAINLWGNYVIRRGEVDRTALSQSIQLLESGQMVLIAPEGTRNPDGLGAPKDGVAYIAQRSNAVVLPAAILGAQDWSIRLRRLQRAYARVVFGRPFQFVIPEGQRLNKAVRNSMMREAMYQIARLIPDDQAHQRGLYRDLDQATTGHLKFV